MAFNVGDTVQFMIDAWGYGEWYTGKIDKTRVADGKILYHIGSGTSDYETTADRMRPLQIGFPTNKRAEL